MSRKIFEDRERALEYEFFHEVDLKLLADLRAKLDKDEQREGLQRATGIRDQLILDQLLDLGLRCETILALSLFPLVHVAWADGNVDSREASAILQAAESICHGPESAAYHLLETWLQDRPCEKVFDVWRQYTQNVFRALTAEAVDSLRRDIVSRARAVAAAAGGVLGLHRVSASEELAIKELTVAMTFDADDA